MKAKEIILLIFIIVAGVFFYYAQTGKLDINWEVDGHFIFRFKEFTFEESQPIEPPFPPLLQINNAHGDIEIQGSEEGKIKILFQKIIWRKNEDQAKEVSDNLKMIIDKNESQLTISTNRDEFKRRNFKTNFRIIVPAGMEIEVKNSYGSVRASKVGKAKIINRHGKVTASDIKGNLTIQNSYQDVEAENVEADCQVESKHSTLFLNNIEGKTDIEHRYGKINLEDISRQVTIEGSHSEVFGQNVTGGIDVETSYKNITLLNVGPTKITNKHSLIEVDGTEGPLEINHQYGKIKLNNIQGNLSIEGKNVAVLGKTIVGKKIYISSSYQNIELTEFSGETSISISHGEIILEPSLLTNPIKVEGQYADIKFYWPFKEKYPFEARAKNGEIKWNLPSKVDLQEENGTSTVKAFTQEKEKPSIFLSTSYATIRIEEQ